MPHTAYVYTPQKEYTAHETIKVLCDGGKSERIRNIRLSREASNSLGNPKGENKKKTKQYEICYTNTDSSIIMKNIVDALSRGE